jgi:hypothetical protein
MEAGRVDRRRRVVDWSEAGQATKRAAWHVWMGEVLPLSLSLLAAGSWLLAAGWTAAGMAYLPTDRQCFMRAARKKRGG